MTEPPVRTLHHFACTGGTLISKSLASMPNVVLLNEVDPLSRQLLDPNKQVFAPRDVISALHHNLRPFSDEVLASMFVGALTALKDDLDAHGRYLLLRDHSHSHYCTDSFATNRPTMRDITKRIGPVLSVVTIRHPRDSFASLSNRHWVHFHPSTVDEYARRYMAFLDAYDDVPWHKYEDFVKDPAGEARSLCQVLEFGYFDGFQSALSGFGLSGDSGRTGATIEPRPQRQVPPKLAQEIDESTAFSELCSRLGYA